MSTTASSVLIGPVDQTYHKTRSQLHMHILLLPHHICGHAQLPLDCRSSQQIGHPMIGYPAHMVSGISIMAPSRQEAYRDRFKPFFRLVCSDSLKILESKAVSSTDDNVSKGEISREEMGKEVFHERFMGGSDDGVIKTYHF